MIIFVGFEYLRLPDEFKVSRIFFFIEKHEVALRYKKKKKNTVLSSSRRREKWMNYVSFLEFKLLIRWSIKKLWLF